MDRLEEIKLEKTGRLMDFHVADGHVNLHFNDELVSLLREVRALQALGFTIPSAIQAEVATANKFYRQGMVLKQVCLLHAAMLQRLIFVELWSLYPQKSRCPPSPIPVYFLPAIVHVYVTYSMELLYYPVCDIS